MAPFKTSKQIDSYIRNSPAAVQKMLKSLRMLIRKTAPAASEKIAWGMPTFYLHGNLIHFASFKSHLSLFPGSEAVAYFKPELRQRGLFSSKGTIQIPYEIPLPIPLVIRIVKFCVKRNLMEVSMNNPTGTRLERPKRPRHAMPPFVRSALLKAKLMEAYRERPPYQQNDYVGWISQAAREETQKKRLNQMLKELRSGDKYMNMPYRLRKKK